MAPPANVCPAPPRRARARARGVACALALVAAACSGAAAPSASDQSAPVATTAGASASAVSAAGTTDTVEVVTSRTTMHIAAMHNGEPPALPPGAVPFGVDFNGSQIRGIDIPGPGPAVVLMHGFPDNIHLYDQLYPLLAGHREVVAFDWIGWGQSDKPAPKVFPYTSATMTNELAAVVQARNLSGFTLVAHDSSGPPGIDYSIANPAKVAKLVLLNTYYELTPTLRPPEAIVFAADPGLQAAENALEADPTVVQSLYQWQLHTFVSTKPGADTFINNLYTEFPEARPAFVALNDVLYSEVGNRKASQLTRLTMPVAIVWGSDDPYLNTGVAQDFKANIPGATLELIAHAGHFVQFDAPQQVAQALGSP